MIMHSDVIDVLNDLVRINNDRTAGYEKALTETRDTGLQHIFTSMASQSRDNAAALNSLIGALGGDEEADATTLSGKLYRSWMDLKSAFNSSDASVLASCEYGETVALKVYDMALNFEEHMPENIRDEIARQRAELQLSHDRIKKYHDMNAEAGL